LMFSYDILFKPLEFILFLIAIFAVIAYETPKPDENWIEPKFDSFYLMLHGIWLGRASLWRVFWPFFIIANLSFFYIDYRVENITYTIASWRTVHMILFLPLIIWLVGIWRSSSNVNRKIWIVLARTAAIYFTVDFIVRVYISFEFPQILFPCRLLLLEYGDCF
jgi:hypothetical protein